MMGVYIDSNKLAKTTKLKTISFVLPNVGNNFKHKIESIINHYEFLVKHRIKNDIDQYLYKYNIGNNIPECRK